MSFKRAVSALAIAAACTASPLTQEPCAQVASIVQSNSTINIPASLAEACYVSAPIVKDDALRIIDGLLGMYEWQTTVAWLEDPPSDYPFPAVNIAGDLRELRLQVASDNLTSEIYFERNVSAIIGQAHDGHFNYVMDGMNVFAFRNGFGQVDMVSLDGEQLPDMYLHDEVVAYANGSGPIPSAIVQINGLNATDFIMSEIENPINELYQDLDALFNDFMSGPTLASGLHYFGSFDFAQGFTRGDGTTITFANGTTASFPNYATTTYSFQDVYDGPSFTQTFCHPTKDLRRSVRNTSSHKMMRRSFNVKRDSADIDPSYPAPVVISSDQVISGYFLNTSGFESTAVLVISTFEPASADEFQSVMYQFLEMCRTENMTNLVIDITNNPGGDVILGYDSFKQLFPDIEPYAAGNMRATDALNVIGESITENALLVEQADPSNITDYDIHGGFSDYNGREYLNDSAVLFDSWSDLYGPVTAHGDEFTNLFRWDYSNTTYTQNAQGNFTVSGYGGQAVGPQPFEPANIIIVGDGRCSSTCTIFSHLLKWQAKVKSIAIGGRPQTGPMQSQGGVKGSQVQTVATQLLEVAGYMTADQISALENTTSAALFDNGELMLRRTASGNLTDNNELSYNSKNNIAEGDITYTPLQFVYEAADCKLWNRPQWIVDQSSKWSAVAQQAFGLNGTTAWSGCVEGSTGHPSSLSGNMTLDNDGVPNNVTVFITEGTNATSAGE